VYIVRTYSLYIVISCKINTGVIVRVQYFIAVVILCLEASEVMSAVQWESLVCS